MQSLDGFGNQLGMLGLGERDDWFRIHLDCGATMPIAGGCEGGGHIVAKQRDVNAVGAVADTQDALRTVAGIGCLRCRAKIDVT